MKTRLYIKFAFVLIAVLMLLGGCSTTDGGPRQEYEYIYVNNTTSTVVIEEYDYDGATVPFHTYSIERGKSITIISYFNALEVYLREPFSSAAYLRVYANGTMTEYQNDGNLTGLFDRRSYVKVDDDTYIWVFE